MNGDGPPRDYYAEMYLRAWLTEVVAFASHPEQTDIRIACEKAFCFADEALAARGGES